MIINEHFAYKMLQTEKFNTIFLINRYHVEYDSYLVRIINIEGNQKLKNSLSIGFFR